MSDEQDHPRPENQEDKTSYGTEDVGFPDGDPEIEKKDTPDENEAPEELGPIEDNEEEAAGPQEDDVGFQDDDIEDLKMPQEKKDQNVHLSLEMLERLNKNIESIPEKFAQVVSDSIAAFAFTDKELSEDTNWDDNQTIADRLKGADPLYIKTFESALRHMDSAGIGSSALTRKGSSWDHVVEEGEGDNVRKFGMGIRRIPTGGDSKLTGREANVHVRSILGLSRPQIVPLPHSGIWVEIEPPKLSSVAMLCQRIMSEKDSIGRRDKAVMLSNNTVFIREHLIDFILKHIAWTNYEQKDAESLKSAISLLDYPVLIIAMAATLWPERYPLTVPCMADQLKCQHLTVYDMFIHRMTVIDSASLSEEQRKQLFQGKQTVTHEKLLAFKEQALGGNPERRALVSDKPHGRIFVVFRHPTLDQHLRQGKNWIHGINEQVLEEMSSASREDMDEMMNQMAALSLTREHSHWVKSVIVEYEDGEQAESSEEDDVMRNLEVIMEDDEAANLFFERLKEYISDCTVAVVGVPRVRCSNCGKRLNMEDSRNPLSFVGAYDTDSLIPVDAESTFFTLALSRATVEM